MTPDDDFLIDGLDCECDGADDTNYRCPNHHDDAEAAYWLALFLAAPAAIVMEVPA